MDGREVYSTQLTSDLNSQATLGRPLSDPWVSVVSLRDPAAQQDQGALCHEGGRKSTL